MAGVDFLPVCDLLFNLISLTCYFCDIVFTSMVTYKLYSQAWILGSDLVDSSGARLKRLAHSERARATPLATHFLKGTPNPSLLAHQDTKNATSPYWHTKTHTVERNLSLLAHQRQRHTKWLVQGPKIAIFSDPI